MKRENDGGIIYSAKFKYDENYYIGATTNTMEERIKDHLNKASQDSGHFFHQCLATFGPEAFEWEQIDTASSINELASKEKYYITKYNSQKNGFNMNSGGGFKKKIYMYDRHTGSHLKVFNSLKEAAFWAGVSSKEISRTCLSKHKSISGFIWSYELYNYLFPEKDNRCKIVTQYTIDGDLICYYESVSDASSFTGINKCSIAKVCRCERNHAGGFIWKYE